MINQAMLIKYINKIVVPSEEEFNLGKEENRIQSTVIVSGVILSADVRVNKLHRQRISTYPYGASRKD
jgi:hypothetical protein